MDSLQFLNSIKFREQFEKTDVSELALLLKNHPYFHSAHLLMAKKLHDTKNVEFEAKLGKENMQWIIELGEIPKGAENP